MKRTSMAVVAVIATCAAVLFGAAVLAPPALAETTARQRDVRTTRSSGDAVFPCLDGEVAS